MNNAIEHDEGTTQYIKSARERRLTKQSSPSLNNATNNAATSQNFIVSAASAFDLKSQYNSANILIDDKNLKSLHMNNGNNTETDSVLKMLKLPCYNVAKKVTNAEKLKTKACLKSKLPKFKKSVQGQPVPSSTKGVITKYFAKL